MLLVDSLKLRPFAKDCRRNFRLNSPACFCFILPAVRRSLWLAEACKCTKTRLIGFPVDSAVRRSIFKKYTSNKIAYCRTGTICVRTTIVARIFYEFSAELASGCQSILWLPAGSRCGNNKFNIYACILDVCMLKNR